MGVLDADQLARSIFPLGESTKAQVRQEAAERGCAVARKPDSHDICFIPDGDTRGWLTKRLGDQPGELVTPEGESLGHHHGTYGFTIGQRRGLGLERSQLDGEPRYVVGIDAPRRQVVIGTADLLGIELIEGDRTRWCGPVPQGPLRAGAQVRAHGAEVPCVAEVRGQTISVSLDHTISGVAPGQSVVIYSGTRVVGSATITNAGRNIHPSTKIERSTTQRPGG